MNVLWIDDVERDCRVRVANTWWRRAIGLLGTRVLDERAGLWLEPCNAVHTFGMRYPIDVVFVAGDRRVAKIVRDVAPWRVTACRRARATLELPAGRAAELGLRPGDRVGLSATSLTWLSRDPR